MCYFVYYINILITFLTIFRRFPINFRRLSKICPKATLTFPNIFRKSPKISEENRRLPNTFEENPMMFRSDSNAFKYSLRNLLCNHGNGDRFTCENNMLFSNVEIPCFLRKLTQYFTGVFICKKSIYFSTTSIVAVCHAPP